MEYHAVNVCLKESILLVEQMLTGIQFQNRGPVSSNEFSKRVVVGHASSFDWWNLRNWT